MKPHSWFIVAILGIALLMALLVALTSCHAPASRVAVAVAATVTQGPARNTPVPARDAAPSARSVTGVDALSFAD
jgi:hypothetical protein